MTSSFLIDIRDKLNAILGHCRKSVNFTNGVVDIKEKERFDYVTDVDVASESFLSNQLLYEFPDFRVVGEESIDPTKNLNGYCWIVDPLDGTFNFICKIPFYGISVALLYEGEPVVAAIYDLLHDELFDAVKNKGSRVNGKEMTNIESNSKAIAISSGLVDYLNTSSPYGLVQLRKLAKLRILGAQALQLAYVADGRLEACISAEAKLWDDVAGALIVQESGKFYGTFSGNAFPAFTTIKKAENIHSLACTFDIKDQLVQTLKGEP